MTCNFAFQELKELAGNPSPGCSAGPINDDSKQSNKLNDKILVY